MHVHVLPGCLGCSGHWACIHSARQGQGQQWMTLGRVYMLFSDDSDRSDSRASVLQPRARSPDRPAGPHHFLGYSHDKSSAYNAPKIGFYSQNGLFLRFDTFFRFTVFA